MLISVTGYAQQPASINADNLKSKTVAAANAAAAPATPNPATPTQAAPTTPAPTPAPAAAPAEELEKPILIMINELSPDQMIVFDTTGKWLDTVKSISMNVDVGSGSIIATITSWKGVLKPKTPKINKYKVKELKSVTEDVFNEKLEEINK